MHRIPPAIATAERVARIVFKHDLRDRELYIVEPARESLVTRERLGGRSGLYFRGLDKVLRRELESQGKWRGPGIAIVVDAFWQFVNAADDHTARRRVVATCLHELCHWADMGEPADPAADHCAKFVAACEASKTPPAEPCEFTPEFLAHGEDFTRIICHAWYRCSRGGGLVIGARDFGFGNAYTGLEWLPTPDAFIDSLWPELESSREVPMSEITSMPVTPEYKALWDRTLVKQFVAAHEAA